MSVIQILVMFYIGIPVLAFIAGLLSRIGNRTLTTIFNLLMLLAILAAAIWVLEGHHGWIHILSFIGLTIFGNLVGVLLGNRGKH